MVEMIQLKKMAGRALLLAGETLAHSRLASTKYLSWPSQLWIALPCAVAVALSIAVSCLSQG